MHWPSLPPCVAFAALIFSSTLFAAGRVDDFVTVKNWHGTLKITGTGSGTSKGNGISDVWQYGITSNVIFELLTYDPNIQGWKGTFSGSSNIDASDVFNIGGCTETFTQMFQGKLDGGGFVMQLDGTNQYEFYPLAYQSSGGDNETDNSCAVPDRHRRRHQVVDLVLRNEEQLRRRGRAL